MINKDQLARACSQIDSRAEHLRDAGMLSPEITESLARSLGVDPEALIHVVEQRAWRAVNALTGKAQPQAGDIWQEPDSPFELVLRLATMACALDGIMTGLRAAQNARQEADDAAWLEERKP